MKRESFKGGLPSGACSIGWARRCAESKGRKCRCSCGGANHGRQIRMPFFDGIKKIDEILDRENGTNPGPVFLDEARSLIPHVGVDLAAPGSKDIAITAYINVPARKLNSASMNMEFQYPGLAGFPSQCNLHILVQPGCKPVVVMTEVPENPGTSVTNAVEKIATKVYWEFLSGNARPQDVRFVEHYKGFTGKEETFDLVILKWNFARKEFFDPEWRPIRKEEVYEASVIQAESGPGPDDMQKLSY